MDMDIRPSNLTHLSLIKLYMVDFAFEIKINSPF